LLQIQGPEGPIVINRNNSEENISTGMLWRMANALSSGEPIHVDSLFQGGGNTRSAFEALLANTANIFVCRPARFEFRGGSTIIVDPAPKHIFWDPSQTHPIGEIKELKTSKVVSTLNVQFVQDSIELTGNPSGDLSSLRTHVQKQFLLMEAAKAFGSKAAIPANDGSNKINGERIDSYDHMVKDLSTHPIFQSTVLRPARETAKQIDCLWLDFENNDIPAIFEVEHSTGVESGLTRMLQLKHNYKGLSPKNIIVAPDEDREKVMRLAAERRYRELDVYYMSYSKLDELSYFVSKKMTRGISIEFLENFIEKCPQPHRTWVVVKIRLLEQQKLFAYLVWHTKL